ncbi:hypothetical protein T265_01426 [Opisthorchis viverrini]|uniref:Uncharacterized protein n=1 Tax=Opisthorchis viverrini TaxID=6198 RepID=A0A074ZZP4_OPIVI|nr:hypothetical protein T265_01426 [Opisthorchis viverrini]KER32551.1 hypothetical protein T265_01426 [Opisthorchis viverrini]
MKDADGFQTRQLGLKNPFVLHRFRQQHLRIIRGSTSPGSWGSNFKPKHPVYLAAFNVHTVKQAVQRTAPPLTLDLPDINVQPVVELSVPSLSTHFRQRQDFQGLVSSPGEENGYPLIVACVWFVWQSL